MDGASADCQPGRRAICLLHLGHARLLAAVGARHGGRAAVGGVSRQSQLQLSALRAVPADIGRAWPAAAASAAGRARDARPHQAGADPQPRGGGAGVCDRAKEAVRHPRRHGGGWGVCTVGAVVVQRGRVGAVRHAARPAVAAGGDRRDARQARVVRGGSGVGAVHQAAGDHGRPGRGGLSVAAERRGGDRQGECCRGRRAGVDDRPLRDGRAGEGGEGRRTSARSTSTPAGR